MGLAAIGDALIDTICEVPETFLTANAIDKSSCVYISKSRADELAQAIQSQNIMTSSEAGGSGANVAAVMGALGGDVSFFGKHANDEYGHQFAQSLERWNVKQPFPVVDDPLIHTSHLYAFITPDKERSFASYHGAGYCVSPDDIHEGLFTKTKCFYVDGYILMAPEGFETALKALRMARKLGCLTVFNPSSLSVLQKKKASIDDLLPWADGIICNELEAQLMTSISDRRNALSALAKDHAFAAITLGAEGAIAQQGEVILHRPNPPLPGSFMNTNGAGDGFAGGFLYGLIHEWPLPASIDLGLNCAVDIICRSGARPETSLVHLLSLVQKAA